MARRRTRVVASWTLLLLAPLVLPLAPSPVMAEEYEALASRLSPRAWGQLDLKGRREALPALDALEDPRGVDLLLKLQRKQLALIKPLRKSWEKREAAWAKKTDKLEAPVEKERREAYRRGETASISGEARDWIGSKSRTGEMYAAKAKIERLYERLTWEEWIVDRLSRAAKNLVSRLKGDTRQERLRRLMQGMPALPPRYRAVAIELIGTLKEPEVAAWLAKQVQDRDRAVAASACRGLGRQGTDEAARLLIERLTASRWQARADAMAGLALCPRPESVEALLERGETERGVLRDHCQRALQTLLGGRHATNVPAWKTWWTEHRDVVEAAWAKGERARFEAKEDDAAGKAGATSFYGIATTSRHIIFVVDMSSSMKKNGTGGKPRFEVAKDQLAKAIETLYEDQGDDAGPGSFNIIAYGTYVSVYRKSGMVKATRRAKEKALEWIEETCIPVGRTNSFDALAAAFALAEKGNANGQDAADTIYFMTDAGAPNRGRHHGVTYLLHAVKVLNHGRHMTIHSVGVGTSIDAKMLKDLARDSGGQTVAR